VLVVAARPDWEAALARGHPRGDGILTSAGTFQKFFEQEELRSWIQAGIGVEPVAAAPGIFYVFRSPAEAAGIRARRIRQRAIGVPRPRKADVLWDCHRELLEPLASFWEERGRLPDFAELEEAVEIEKVIGSLRVAASVLKRVLGEERFENARKRAELDLQVFLALEAFRGRSRFNELPRDVTLDVRAHFGNYKNACATADLLLFTLADEERLGGALREANFGKVLPDAVYFHVDYIHRLDPLLRVYEGAARALLGDIEPVTLVKMSRTERRVSYLWYPH
jgi:DNA phosphorothioation-associated putative methyltransferase